MSYISNDKSALFMQHSAGEQRAFQIALATLNNQRTLTAHQQSMLWDLRLIRDDEPTRDHDYTVCTTSEPGGEVGTLEVWLFQPRAMEMHASDTLGNEIAIYAGDDEDEDADERADAYAACNAPDGAVYQEEIENQMEYRFDGATYTKLDATLPFAFRFDAEDTPLLIVAIVIGYL